MAVWIDSPGFTYAVPPLLIENINIKNKTHIPHKVKDELKNL